MSDTPETPLPSQIILPGSEEALDLPEGFAARRAQLSDPAPRRSPVKRITAQNDQVLFELTSGERVPVSWKVALERASAIMAGMMHEDGSKPQDELDRECWLLDGIVRAVADCRKQMLIPMDQRKVDRALRQIDAIKKRIRTVNFSQGLTN